MKAPEALPPPSAHSQSQSPVLCHLKVTGATRKRLSFKQAVSLTSATLTYDLTHRRSSPGGWRGRRERRRHTSTSTATVFSCSCLDFTTNTKKVQSRSISWPMTQACVALGCRLRSGGQIKIKRLRVTWQPLNIRSKFEFSTILKCTRYIIIHVFNLKVGQADTNVIGSG